METVLWLPSASPASTQQGGVQLQPSLSCCQFSSSFWQISQGEQAAPLQSVFSHDCENLFFLYSACPKQDACLILGCVICDKNIVISSQKDKNVQSLLQSNAHFSSLFSFPMISSLPCIWEHFALWYV